MTKLSFDQISQIANNRFLGNVSGSTGNVGALTGTQATTLLDSFTDTLKGLVPASGGGTTNFLRADGTWAAPAGGGGGGGTTTNAVTFNSGGLGAASPTTFDGSVARTISYNSIGAQPLDDTLTALAGATWTAGTQVLTLTAADTITLKTVGQAAGNIIDKAAGDALYQPLGSYQASNALLTAYAGQNWSSGVQVPTLTASNTVALKTVGSAAGNLLDKAAGDALYQPLAAKLTDLAALSYTGNALKVLRVNSGATGFELATAAAGLSDGSYGDITVGSSGTTMTIVNNAVTLAKMAQVATATFLGRTTASTGNVEALTATQATALLDSFTSGAKGLAPASGGGTTNFLRADGTWAAPAGGGGGGSSTWGTPVKTSSTTNFANTSPTSTVLTASATGASVIDGVTLALNDRVLLRHQTLPAENGVYSVTTAGTTGVATVLTRATDADTWAELPSLVVVVQQGSTYADTMYLCTSDTGGTLGTTAVNWTTILTLAAVANGISGFCSGLPDGNEVVAGAISPYAYTLDTLKCSAKSTVAATASTVFTIKNNGSAIGTITFAIGATSGTISISTPAVVAGDYLTIHAPASPDSTLANIGFLLRN